MEKLYKKRPLKFSGLAAEVRASEMNAARGSVRQQQFSLQRALVEPKESEKISKIPMIGKGNSQKEDSRLLMLQKWKQEKTFRKQLKKKPVFKVGSATNAPLDTLGSSRLQSFQAKPPLKNTLLKPNSSKDAVQSKPIKPATCLPQKQHSSKDKCKTFPTQASTSRQLEQNSSKDKCKTLPTQPSTSRQQEQNSSKNKLPAFTKPAASNLQPKQNPKERFQPITTKSSIQQKQNSATKSVVPPQSSVNPHPKQNFSKVSGISKPLAFLPHRKPQNPPSRLKPVSNISSEKPISKEKPVEKSSKETPEPTKTEPSSTLFDQSLAFSRIEPGQVSRIEPVRKSFAPPNYVFCPPKIRESWLEEEGLFSITARLRTDLDANQRTSTPNRKELKKLQLEFDQSSIKDNSLNPEESSSQKSNGNIPHADTQKIEVLTDSPASDLPCKVEEPLASNTDCEEETSVHITDLALAEMENLKREANAIPRPEESFGQPEVDPKLEVGLVPSDEKNKKQDILIPPSEDSFVKPEVDPKFEVGLVPSDAENLKDAVEECYLKNEKFTDHITPAVKKEDTPTTLYNIVGDHSVAQLSHLRELSVNVCAAERNPQGAAQRGNHSPSMRSGEVEGADSVFLPDESLQEKSTRRVTRSLWKIEKPSLAQINESPENSPEVVATPKSNRRKGKLLAGFTPRRSARIARLSELKVDENIFDVEPCYLESSAAEAASRMSMALPYDFDKLHLEAKGGKSEEEKSEPTSSKPMNRKVSLLYTPPRSRASIRKMSLKGDLMQFSPNVE